MESLDCDYHGCIPVTWEIFVMRVVKHWHRLPGEEVDASSLETFKVRLDGELSNLISLKMSLMTTGALD